MKKITAVIAAAFLVSSVSVALASNGEEVFNKNCKACHANGGNIANPKKTLKKADMDANNLKTVDDVVKLIRNATKPMPSYDASKISDADAKAVSEYILKTFAK
ncbi:MAG: c-type cytochrome [Nitrospirota bacterium]|nr:c-type cytochrome [Nitrospirota bacterium]